MERKFGIALTIITIGTVASGWIGAAVNRALGEPHQRESLGTLIWISLPLLLVFIARLLRCAKSSGRWMPRFRQAWPMYLVALAAFPVVTALTVGVSAAAGWMSIAPFDWGRLLPVVGSALVAAMLKNVFEEAVWRSWFTGELDARKWPDWAVYLVVGLVWALWHVPYYLFFLPESDMRFILDVPRGVFALVAGFTMMAWGVLFTEVYRIAKSIWPVVLLHAVEDATVNPILLDGHVIVEPGRAIWVSPVVGIVPALLYMALGFGLRAWRRRSATSPANR